MEEMENNNMNEAEVNGNKGSKKNWLTTLILCWFLGFFGVHRMYAGKVGSGLLVLSATILSAELLFKNIALGLMCFTLVGAYVVNDFLRIATKTFKDCYGEYIVEDKI